MLDLGTSFLASVARDPHAPAIVDDDVRLTYRQWYGRISALVAGFDELGLKRGDHLITVLQNRWQAATLHWACQFAGIVITPLNWRATADDLDFCVADAETKGVVYEDVAAEAVRASKEAGNLPRIAVGAPRTDELSFDSLAGRTAPDADEASIREFLGGHLCRCTGYVPIVAAALDAAEKLKQGVNDA